MEENIKEVKENKLPEDTQKKLDRIANFEKLGGENFFQDINDDPPTKVLNPEDVDYLKKKLSSKLKNLSCRRLVSKMLKNYAVEHKIEVQGLENLEAIEGGAIITTNHFHFFDSAPLVYAVKNLKKKHKMHIVIREGNYQVPGMFGFILKNYYTFPLSSNMRTMVKLNNAIETVLKKGDFVLVYPEQAMWWKYRKPRFYRIGAFKWAAKNNVPLLPCFVTMEDMEAVEEDGLKAQKLTLHIGTPIYPNKDLSVKENAEQMLEKNKEFTVSIYEKVYDLKYDLKYDNN